MRGSSTKTSATTTLCLSDSERADLPKGRALVEEGVKLGAAAEHGVSAWSAKTGYKSDGEYRRDMAARGELTWSFIMGLASLDEQVEGLREIDAACERHGVRIDRGSVIPSPLSGLPREHRSSLPKTTSFILDGREDHIRIAQAAPFLPVFGDFHIGSPAALENTLDAMAAGCPTHGIFSQFMWTLPGWDDEVAALVANIKAVGAVASRYAEKETVESYLDDGAPSHFADHVSTVGYALIERHVVCDLCGARYSASFGGLISSLSTKIAVLLALNQLLSTDVPGIAYVYGTTTDSNAELPISNYGQSSVETLLLAATEKRFRTGASILPVPIYEKVRVPSAAEIFELHTVCHEAIRHADELAGAMDFASILATRDILIQQGRVFAQNALREIASLGWDTNDPLQMLLALRRIGPVELERLAHPRGCGDDKDKTIDPWVPTELALMSQKMCADEIAAVRAAALGGALRGKRIVVGSSDTHTFGLQVLTAVLEAFEAETVSGGSDMDEVDFVRLARETHADAVAVSAHNGQCLAFSRGLLKLIDEAGLSCPVFIGGQLNGYVNPEDKLPQDVSPQLREAGVIPCSSTVEMVRSFDEYFG